MKAILKRLWADQEGQDLTEYALLIVLIGLAAIVGMQGLANAINNTFLSAGSNMSLTT
jgi:pilus assembly protein Flp/PilA